MTDPTSALRLRLFVVALLLAALLLLLSIALLGCRPDLPEPPPSPGSSPSTATKLAVSFFPDAPLEAVPRVVRLKVSAPEPFDDERVFLVRGDVRSSHLGQIERGEISKALASRMIDVVRVWDADGALWLSPTAALEPGLTYAIASAEPRAAVHFVVEPAGSLPLPFLSRVWPDVGGPAMGVFGVWCGDVSLPDVSADLELWPSGVQAIASHGLSLPGPGLSCLRIQGRQHVEPGLSLSPPFIDVGPPVGRVLLEPLAFEAPSQEPADLGLRVCDPNESVFGPGCVEVMDDRLIGRAPASPFLWGIAGEGLDVVMTTHEKERFVLKGFSPDRRIELDVVSVDISGLVSREVFVAQTASPMPHLVLNEVMANPLGPEPHQEWVELVNDGAVAAQLGGYRLFDIGGETVLPDVTVPPGAFVLVVNKTFVEDDEIDVPPWEGAVVVRVSALGKGGLGNAGEPLRLEDPSGRVISRFPALPKPKAGKSVARRSPSAADGVDSSFVLADPTPGGANETPSL